MIGDYFILFKDPFLNQDHKNIKLFLQKNKLKIKLLWMKIKFNKMWKVYKLNVRKKAIITLFSHYMSHIAPC